MIGASCSDSLATDSNSDSCWSLLAEVGIAVARDRYGDISAVDEDLREVGEIGDARGCPVEGDKVGGTITEDEKAEGDIVVEETAVFE